MDNIKNLLNSTEICTIHNIPFKYIKTTYQESKLIAGAINTSSEEYASKVPFAIISNNSYGTLGVQVVDNYVFLKGSIFRTEEDKTTPDIILFYLIKYCNHFSETSSEYKQAINHTSNTLYIDYTNRLAIEARNLSQTIEEAKNTYQTALQKLYRLNLEEEKLNEKTEAVPNFCLKFSNAAMALKNHPDIENVTLISNFINVTLKPFFAVGKYAFYILPQMEIVIRNFGKSNFIISINPADKVNTEYYKFVRRYAKVTKAKIMLEYANKNKHLFAHPHIYGSFIDSTEETNFCFGNNLKLLSMYNLNHELYLLIITIIKCLKTVNENDKNGTAAIIAFPSAEDKGSAEEMFNIIQRNEVDKFFDGIESANFPDVVMQEEQEEIVENDENTIPSQPQQQNGHNYQS